MKLRKKMLCMVKQVKKITIFACLVCVVYPIAGIQAAVGEQQSVAQTLKKIKGKVIDVLGEPLIGVNVSVVGQTGGTITDIDGNYSLDVPAGAKLKFSYIGYEDQIIDAGVKAVLNVTMKESTEVLEEVVVVGYGAQKKETLTGAVTVVSDKMLKDKGALSNPAQALQGQVPGVIITRNSAAPGDESWNMKLRGSFSKNNSAPLVIIDGVESDDFSQLNPGDIESINFLKDASAAIYGSKAAGGVVLVQTKKAKEGKVKVEYSGSVTAKFVGLQPTLMTLDEWCDAMEQARLNDNKKLADDQWLQYVALARQNKGHYINVEQSGNPFPDSFQGLYDFVFFDTDWQDIMWGTAASTSHELSVSGGNERSVFRLSGRYMYDDSNLKWGNNKNQRYNFRLSNTFHLTKNFDLESIIFYYRQDQVSPTQIGEALTAGTQQPGFPSSTMDGKPYAWGNWATPNWRCELGGDNKLNTSGINISETFKYRFDEHFDAVATLGYNTSTAIRDVKNQTVDYYDYTGTKRETRVEPRQEDTYYIKTTARTNLYTLNFYLNWKRTFGSHNLGMMLGTQYSMKEYDYTATKALNILPSLNIINGIGEITLRNTKNEGPSRYQEALLSYFARLNYNYKSLYYATVSFRSDGSSKFRGDNRFGYFPSGSLAWGFMEEDFMKPLKSVVSSGKLRASWGLTGNNRVGEYDTYALYQILKDKVGDFISIGSLPSGVYPFENSLTSVGTVPTSLRNRKLKWETTEQWNLGLDLGFLDERIGLTVDWYRKTTRDLLLNTALPTSSGYFSAMKNVGKVRNQGIELTLNTTNIKNRHFSWTTNFNIAFNKNKVLELAENQSSLLSAAKFDQNYNSQYSYIAKVGYPMGMMYGFIYEGTYKYEDFDKVGDTYTLKRNVPYFSSESNTQPGMPKYADLNGDGIIDDNDRTMIGNGMPKHTGGFTNNFEYKGFDLSIFFQWSYGNDVLNANRLFFENSNKTRDLNQYASYADRWTPENPESNIPRATDSGSNKVFSTRIIEDGSFLRLKTVSLGYTLPKQLTKKWKIDNARVFVAGQNLWTCTGYSGYDPEVSIREGALTPGLDFSAYPRAYSISFGINLGF